MAVGLGVAWCISAACAAGVIVAKQQQALSVHRLLKPLPVLTLGAFLLTHDGWSPTVVGLCFAALGDYALAQHERWLRAGVGCFAAMHLCYIYGWGLSPKLTATGMALLAVLLGLGGWILGTAWTNLGRLRIPGTLYCAILCVMTWRCILVGIAADEPVKVVGGMLFFVADSLLTLRRFAKWQLPYSLEFGSYVLAQMLITKP